MTRPPRRRTPRPDPTTITTDLQALQTRLDQLPDVIAILTDTATTGYPANTSGTDGTRGSSNLTQPERLTFDPDRDAARAIEALQRLTDLTVHLRTATRIIDANARNRAIKRCTSCTNPWDDNWHSCRWPLPSGGMCMHIPGSTDDADLCGNPNCKTKLVAGQRSTWGEDNITRCLKCAAYVRKYGSERRPDLIDTGRTAGVARLELGTGSDVQVTQ